MKRGDAAVFSISAVLGVVAAAATAFSVFVLDREPSSAAISQGADSSLLVITWAPTFCKVTPDNRGCASGQVGEMGPTFILHGLWPQPPELQYCGLPAGLADRVHQGKRDLPPVELNDEVRQDVQEVLSSADVMVPHEWYTHGTCSGVTPDEYFGDAAALTREARQVLDPLFVGAQGDRVELNTIRDNFDDAFGPGAGERVALSCRDVPGTGAVVYEMLLSLPPADELATVDDSLSLGPLLLAGPPIPSHCPGGAVPSKA